MPEDRVDRRLYIAAIFAGDIAGSSRLMGTDEEGTLRQLKAHSLQGRRRFSCISHSRRLAIVAQLQPTKRQYSLAPSSRAHQTKAQEE